MVELVLLTTYNEEVAVHLFLDGFDKLGIEYRVCLELFDLLRCEVLFVVHLNLRKNACGLREGKTLQSWGYDPSGLANEVNQFPRTCRLMVMSDQFQFLEHPRTYLLFCIAGTICTPDEPLPITATLLPAQSNASSQLALCKSVPSKS